MSRAGDFWEARILPRVIEKTCSDRITGRWRSQLLAPVSGRVLEVGFGSGTNLNHYPDAVTEVLAVEPSDLAWQRSATARDSSRTPVQRIGLDGAALDTPDGEMDAVVSAYTMCTIPDLHRALAEFRRVLRPGGAIYFVEHSLSPDAAVAARQRRIQPIWSRLSGGCHLDRDIPALVSGAGFTLHDLEAFYLPGPGFARPFGWMTMASATVEPTAGPSTTARSEENA